MGEVLIFDKAFLEWKATSDFIAVHLDKALALDAKISFHPVEIECPDAKDVGQIFDILSYSKAASVTSDLWEGISATTSLDVAQIMQNFWIIKTGYPVITVTEDATDVRVHQDRFLDTGIAGSEDNTTLWNVPLGLLSTKDGCPFISNSLILSEREASIELDTTEPFKLNADTTGFYRVLYTPERLERITIEAAKKKSIFSLNDKIGLLQDAFALSKAGLTTLSSCLTLVNLWKQEEEYIVWKCISNSLAELASIWWENLTVTEGLNRFRRTLFVPLVARLGYEKYSKELTDTGLLRTLAVGQALDARDEGVIAELRGRFDHYMHTGDDSKIPVDLQRATFIAAVKYGGRKEYDIMIKIIDNPKTALEKIAAL